MQDSHNEVGEVTDFLNFLIYGRLWADYKKAQKIKVVSNRERYLDQGDEW